ncbi:N-acetyltransferase [Flavobacterium album]|uniref:N-acetyltransferase n=1 Tax=Flavobacterium album TaxID=2175091 RepID=A0A2S1QYK1_9FLAO|nr:GNAT family protein [Flavobacterium album]AWH85465.1 N-acetyltransferase [Flavobacterium album]
MQFEELHTDRLILRKLTPEAYDYIFSTMDDAEIMELFGLSIEEQLEKEKNKYINGMTTFSITFANFLLIDRETGKTIGGCGYHTWVPLHRRAEIGYDLKHEEYKRKGLMTEAVAAVLDYGFKRMGLHRVEAIAADYNEPSIRIINKFGFTFEGTLRGHYNVEGVMEDSVMYSLLEHEYKKL